MARNSVGLKVEGLAQVQRALIQMGVDVEDMKDTMNAIAAEGASVMKTVAPRASGALVSDIRPNRAKGKAVVTVGRASIPYAAPQQWGWGTKAAGFKHGKYRGNIRGNFAGHHYFEKTDALMEGRALQMLEQGINDLIRKTNIQ